VPSFPSSGPQRLTPSQAKPKIEKYCAYQERSHRQVLEKLRGYGLNSQEAGEMLVELLQSNFVSEERFAASFVRGKFGLKGWGRAKIEQALKREGLGARQIETAMKEIPDQRYEETLLRWAERKANSVSGTPFERKMKTKRFLVGKGYEPEAIDSVLSQLDF
jgi:regulatory protein